MKKQQGFTLIELIVVMAIIGILASVIMVNFIGVRQRSRDGVRKSDLSQIRNALELYRSDQGYYPTSLPVCGNPLTSPDGSVTYIQHMPCDPLTNAQYIYVGVNCSSSGCIGYTLTSCLENKSDSQQQVDSSGNPVVNPACQNSTFGASYQVTNP